MAEDPANQSYYLYLLSDKSLKITTLFNLFCPLVLSFHIERRVILLIGVTLLSRTLVLRVLWNKMNLNVKADLSHSLFPSRDYASMLILGLFITLGLLNLISLTVYSYPVTTTLAFNMRVAFLLWLSRIIIFTSKVSALSTLLPQNSPWYLAPFLRIIELVRISVRPVTLCFRLLANISAGHILLALICKIPMSLWVLGTLFGLLELMVAVVQSFVFLILINVYVEESLHHSFNGSEHDLYKVEKIWT